MNSEFHNNQSANGTVRTFGDNASPVFAVFSMTFSLWIVISNLFVLICLIKHRKNLIKNTFTMQILTLSANDFLAGISTIPVYITSFTTNVCYELCIFRLIVFASAQVVVLFHILGICVSRLFIVCQITVPRLRIVNRKGIIIMLLVINWIVGLGIFGVPYATWGKYRQRLTTCSLNEMFQDNYKIYTTYSSSIYLIPSLLTNAVYVAIIVKLRFNTRKVQAGNSLSAAETTSTQSNVNPGPSSEGVSTRKFAALKRTLSKRHKISNVFHYYLKKKDAESVSPRKPEELWAVTIRSLQNAEANADKNKGPENMTVALQTLSCHDSHSARNAENKMQNANSFKKIDNRAQESLPSGPGQPGKAAIKGQRNALTAIGMYGILLLSMFCWNIL